MDYILQEVNQPYSHLLNSVFLHVFSDGELLLAKTLLNTIKELKSSRARNATATHELFMTLYKLFGYEDHMGFYSCSSFIKSIDEELNRRVIQSTLDHIIDCAIAGDPDLSIFNVEWHTNVQNYFICK